jgi:signal transduction histidine kinase
VIAIDLSDPTLALGIDAGALETVLATLGENARQAGASRLDIIVGAQEGAAWIDLIDDGPGIPTGDRDRIFDLFFTNKRDKGGTGLGLPIARSLLTAYRGALHLLPSGRGAHFRLSLPVAP